MKDLSQTEKEKLIADVKSFLDITWADEDIDNELWRNIVDSIRYIDDVSGIELDYLADETTEGEKPYLSLCAYGKTLLKNRVFYIREKALDDFQKNYVSDLTRLYVSGRAYVTKV